MAMKRYKIKNMTYIGCIILIILLMLTVNNINGSQQMRQTAENIMSWQLENGGWTKDNPDIFTRTWDGKEKKAKYYQQDGITPLGTIDNGATVTELDALAKAYHQLKDPMIQESFRRGIEFLLLMQYASGGFPQVYPKQDAKVSLYENMVTYNDDAMINVMYLFQEIIYEKNYYGNGLVEDTLRQEVEKAYNKGVEYMVASQVHVNDQLTAWGGQHDPNTYETVQGRIFEPKSLMSKESIDIIYFLETVRPQTAAIRQSVFYAKSWVKATALENVRYERYGIDGEYFIDNPGHLTWYRFYEIGTNEPLFADFDGTVSHSILDISIERRHGYGWAGSWGKEIYNEQQEALLETTEDERHILFINTLIGLISILLILLIIRTKVLIKRKRK